MLSQKRILNRMKSIPGFPGNLGREEILSRNPEKSETLSLTILPWELDITMCIQKKKFYK